jgi:hypothetical protein
VRSPPQLIRERVANPVFTRLFTKTVAGEHLILYDSGDRNLLSQNEQSPDKDKQSRKRAIVSIPRQLEIKRRHILKHKNYQPFIP